MTHARPTIAVVDDDAGIRAALASLLKSEEFNARTFRSAEAFLARQSDEPFACLIADIHLPGMNGIALLHALAERGQSLPAVLITGRADAATLELLRKAGDIPLLRKPFGEGELFEAMRRAIGA